MNIKFKPWCNRPDIDITKIQNYQEGKKIYGYIYITTFSNKKVYVGQAEHVINSRTEKDYYGSGKIFTQNKYGKENLEKRILRLCYSLEEYNDWERKYIWLFKACDRKYGYNILKGSANDWNGGLNPIHIPEVVEKIRKANTGKKASPEWVEMISETMINYWADPEWRAIQMPKFKIGDQHYTKDGLTEECKIKIGKQLKEFYQTEEGLELRKEQSERGSKHNYTRGISKSKEARERMKITAKIGWENREMNGTKNKYRGVRKLAFRWSMYIRYKKVRYNMTFDTEIEAALAYNELALFAFGDKAKINIIH